MGLLIALLFSKTKRQAKVPFRLPFLCHHSIFPTTAVAAAFHLEEAPLEEAPLEEAPLEEAPLEE
ncbi:MAG: hypothetical protein V4710_00635, partial [Verrucomicrobiota bacterium]